MKYIIPIVLAVALVSCATPSATPPACTGGARDGSSIQRAIVVPKAGEIRGVAYEYEYIRSHYPGAEPVMQSLAIDDAGHAYDAIIIKTREGKQRTLYFDIQRFFGKLP